MPKRIDTLIPDIQSLLGKVAEGGSAEFSDEELAELGASIATAIGRQMNRGTKVRPPKTLYMSEVGQPCKRKLWYRYYGDRYGIPSESMHPNTILKFVYGDIIEELVLALATKAGHDVKDEQKSHSFMVDGWEIRGRQDARIDGHLVDVKSASSFAMNKFRQGLTPDKDAFGYLGQLALYTDETDTSASFLAVDKQTAALVLDTHSDLKSPYTVAEEAVKALQYEKTPPSIPFDTVPDGKSGNLKLCTNCSYCEYKQECYLDANDGKGLRTFAYSTGPKFLTKVVNEPRVLEIT